jgi:hypothetical protein
MRFSSGFMSILIAFIFGSRWRLSEALTRISSKKLPSGGKVLTENLVETWNEGNTSLDYFICLAVVNPQFLLIMFDGADVGVWSEKNMLEGCLLLINLFY